jgi:superfamily II DNA or RNA helicase
MDRTGKIVIEIGKGVKYYNLPEAAKEKIFEDLTFINKKYQEAERYGRYIGPDVPKYHKFFRTDESKSVIWTPRGYLWFIRRWLKRNGYKSTIDDRTITLPKLKLKWTGEDRDYQTTAVDDVIRRYPVGVLEAKTGAGKTVMGTKCIAERQQPTLITVHTKDLMYQWEKAIKTFLNYDCGLVGDGKYKIKPITVAIINSVRNNIEDMQYKFGHIIVDECHRCPSSTWSDTLLHFPAKYYLGLTATAIRKDGLGNAIFAHVGPRIHKVDPKTLHDIGAVLKPKIIRVPTKFRADKDFMKEEALPYATVLKRLTEDEARNKLIARAVYNDLKEYNENVLIVSDRVEHCKEIAYTLKEEMNIESSVLSGKETGYPRIGLAYDDETGEEYEEIYIDSKSRKEIIADVKSGKCKVLNATISLIGEGFDSPNLAALFFGTPVKFSGRVIQTAGRILRPEEGKVPRLYDFRDDDVRVLRNSGFHRDRIYRKEGW